MEFESFSTAATTLFVGTFLLAFMIGAVANKTNFCTMGAVSDWVNMGDKGRFRSWLLAMAVAMVGVIILELTGLVRPSDAFPPYRAGNFAWAEHLVGGILFGIGMALGSGCGNKTLVRIGGGNIKSVLVAIMIGLSAFYMMNPIPGTGRTLYEVLFYWWTDPVALNVGAAQDLGTLVAGVDNANMARFIIGALIAAVVLWYVFKESDFRSHFDNILGGVVVGLAVVGAWVLTSNIYLDDGFGGSYTMQEYVQEWAFVEGDAEGQPARVQPWSTQSFTFVNPMGQSYEYVKEGFSTNFVFFGVIAFLGVIVGSLVWALISRSFRVEWFSSGRDFGNHLIGGILMGLGGTLALGCTIGQAVTGASTLAVGSFLTFAAIVFGAAITMKIQFYKMVYEDEATFMAALQSSLVDMRMLPKGMRKLEAM